MQGRRLLTSLVRSVPKHKPPVLEHKPPYCRPGPRNPWPRLKPLDPYGRPRPRFIVLETIECMKRLHPDEIKKFGYIFSELLELPKPPEVEETPGEKFVVKLVKCDTDNWVNRRKVCKELAWIKSTEKVLKKMSDLGIGPVSRMVENMPSVIKQRVSEEEAREIIARIEAVGGVAVMEPLEE